MQKFLLVACLALIVGVAPSLAGDARVSDTVPTNQALPKISGNPSVGSSLTASSGSWTASPAPTYTYAWLQCDTAGANCTPISGATANVYSVASADGNHTLRVVVTARNSAGSATATSDNTPTITPISPPQNSTAPVISGSTALGGTLTTSNGSWIGASVTFTYQWLRCNSSGASCTNISNATNATYATTSSDVGQTLRVVVTGTNVSGSAEATSAASGVITLTAPASLTAPALSGTATQGQTLSVSTGTWTGSPSYAYAWQRCDASGNNCAAIPGANSTTYVLTAADAGHDIRVTVTATNSAGSNHVTTSAVGPVVGLLPAGATKLPNGEISVPASSVPDTDRLVIVSVSLTPKASTKHAAVAVTFKLEDTAKYDVAGALVYVVAVPRSWAKVSPESATGTDGRVSITVTPTKSAPKRGTLALYVRARTPQGDKVAGSSNRTLISVRLLP